MNKVQRENILDFATSFKLDKGFYGATFLITGATGLIGSTLVHCLLSLDMGFKITCPVRQKEKALKMYGIESKSVNFIECDLVGYLNSLSEDIKFDYIVHCASPTSGKYIKENSVETFELAIDSTRALLIFAKKTNTRSMVYISSLEYYGQMLNEGLVTEDMQGYIDMQDPRSSYSMGKRAAEFLCTSYAKEYGVNVKIARLTQTFGAGVQKDDNRVFAQFARSVISGSDIILHTSGESAKPYCYTTDCISAILYILIKGKTGEAYNVANQDTYISIMDMAAFLCETFNNSIHIKKDLNDEMGYAPVTKLRLSSEKLMNLGWAPKYGLIDMYEQLLAYFKEEMKSS